MAVAFPIVSSDKDTNFTGAIVQNASEDENLSLGQNEVTIISVGLTSDQNLEWEVWFYRTDQFDDSDLDTDSFIAKVEFVAADGEQLAGAGKFVYNLSTLAIPYIDADETQELHVKLVNRSAASKNAGATGEVVLRIGVVE